MSSQTRIFGKAFLADLPLLAGAAEIGAFRLLQLSVIIRELGPDFQQLSSSNDWESIRTWRRWQRS